MRFFGESQIKKRRSGVCPVGTHRRKTLLDIGL
jgi:hypothetical protein